MLLTLLVLAATLWPGLAETAPAQQKGKQAPSDWIDGSTGHRIIRLSSGDGSSLYFHDNTYTPEGDKLIFNSKAGIVAVDLKTLGVKPVERKIVVPGASAIGMARKSREVYFSKGGKGGKGGGGLFAANVDTG